jgi:DNA-binding IscR family transcriptional regulator
MNISAVVYDAVELMVRLVAADPHMTAGELAGQVARSPSSTEALLARLRIGNLVKTVRGHRRVYRTHAGRGPHSFAGPGHPSSDELH